tara:strand:+ start:594 stop:884 length:291 start_codon:yes stop_codon:yes gene_type:complete
MANPLIHTLVLIAAVLIPGGLLVYLAWRAARKASSLKDASNHTIQKEGSEDVSGARPSPQEARSAFEAMFPKDSLRARSRRMKLDRVKAFRHKKSQ